MRVSQYLSDARARAKRRKSPWNLLLVLPVFSLAAALWWVFVQGIWHVHVWFFPSHAGRWSDFWTEGIGFIPFSSSFLMVMPLGLPALTIAMLVSNLMVHGIPPARQILDREATGYLSSDYVSAQRQMVVAVKISIAIAVPLALLGAATLVHLH